MNNFHPMVNWDAFGTMAAKDITWYSASIRAASQAEIEARSATNSLSALSASVSTQAAAISTLQGRQLAYLQQVVNVGGVGNGATAFLEMRAEASYGAGATSQIALGAREIHLYNTVGALYSKVLSVVGGKAIVYGDLDVGGAIRVGTRRIPIALQSFKVSGSDGAVISFGTDLTNIPQVLIDASALPPVPAGQSRDVKVLSLSPTGLTIRAKNIIPGTPSAQNTGAGVAGGAGQPQRVVNKPSVGDSQDGYYNFAATLSLYVQGQNNPGQLQPGDNFNDVGNNYVGFECFVKPNGGAWQSIGYVEAYADGGYTGLQNIYAAGSVYFANAIGQHGDYEFGVTAYAGTMGTFHGVTYTAAGASGGEATATPNGEKVILTIVPQNV
jgi:hypothetical protein